MPSKTPHATVNGSTEPAREKVPDIQGSNLLGFSFMFGPSPISAQLRRLEAAYPVNLIECTSYDEYPDVESDVLRANDPNDHELFDSSAALINRDRYRDVLLRSHSIHRVKVHVYRMSDHVKSFGREDFAELVGKFQAHRGVARLLL